MLTLDAVNRILGTMGIKPLASLAVEHRMLSAARLSLDSTRKNTLASGWWFNTEHNRTILPNLIDSRAYLPSDTIGVRDGSRDVVQRGLFLYDRELGTNVFSEGVTVTLVKDLPLEEIPETAAAYIVACAMYDFQTTYDGDSSKTAKLDRDREQLRLKAKADDDRHSRTNMILNNPRLARLKRQSYWRRFQ
jgi:hypothetical protein